MSAPGNIIEVKPRSRGSQLAGAHTANATSLTVANGTDFDTAGGLLLLDDTVYSWSTVTVNGTVEDATATLGGLSPALVADEPDTMPVELWSGSQVIDEILLSVDTGGESPVSVTLNSAQRKDWSSRAGVVDPPVAALFSDDYSELEDAPGYTPPLDVSNAGGTLPPAIVAQIPTGPTAAPTAVPTPTVYSGSGTSVAIWPAPTEPFTRLRLYVTNTNTDGSINTSAPMDASTLHASDVKPPTFVQALTPGGTALDPSKMYQFALGAFNEVGAGPFSPWVLGTVGQIFPLLIAKEAILGIVTANEITTIRLAGGTINIAQSPAGVEDENFSGTSLPAGWTSGLSTTGTAAVVTSGVPSGTTGSALKLANDGTASSNYVWARSGTINGDAMVETRFQFGGDPFRTGGTGADDSIASIGLRSPSSVTQTSGIYLRFNTGIDTVGGTQNWYVQGGGLSFPTQTMTFTLNTWYRAKVRVLGGQVSAKVWAESGTEPTDWVYGTNSLSLSTGATFARLAGGGSTRLRTLWVDYLKTTAYATGFQVLPDGTGDWPAALDPLRTRLGALEGLNAGTRLTTLEGYNAGSRLTSLESGQTTQNARLSALEGKVGTYAEFIGGNSYTPTSTTNVTTDLTLSFTATATTDRWLVGLAADVQITTAATVNACEVLVDGTALFTVNTQGAANTRVTGYKQQSITGLSAGSHTITVRTRNTAASTGATVRTGQSLLSVERKA